jgi:hypothetical protein
MIELSLDTKAVEKALVKHVRDNLGITTEGKEFEFTVIVGRKTAAKPKPEVTAIVKIFDKDELTTAETTVKVVEPEVVAKKELDVPLGEEVGLPAETPEYSLEESVDEDEDSPEEQKGLFG